MKNVNRKCGCPEAPGRRPPWGCRDCTPAGSVIPSCSSRTCGCSGPPSTSPGDQSSTAWTSERCCPVPWEWGCRGSR